MLKTAFIDFQIWVGSDDLEVPALGTNLWGCLCLTLHTMAPLGLVTILLGIFGVLCRAACVEKSLRTV